MSWIDAARGGADVKVRRTFYIRGLATGGADVSIRINDQLPQNYVFRVSAQGAVAGIVGTALTSATLVEVRLYNAFTTERIYDSSQQAGFIVLGYLSTVNGSGDNAGGAGSFIWQPCAPIESRSTGSGVWRLQLYDVTLGATLLTTKFTSFSFAIDVRAGGPISYPN